MKADVELATDVISEARRLRDSEIARLLTSACEGGPDHQDYAMRRARALRHSSFYMHSSNVVIVKVPADCHDHGSAAVAILHSAAVKVAEHRPAAAVAPFTGNTGAALCW